MLNVPGMERDVSRAKAPEMIGVLQVAAEAMEDPQWPPLIRSLGQWFKTEAASNAGDEDHSHCTVETCTLLAAYATALAYLKGAQRVQHRTD